jgi:hypothetical protein
MPTTYAIPDGRTVMAATTYSGNGGTQAITNTVNGVSFQPDFVWVKSRSGAFSHWLNDSVRGAGYSLSSNLTDAETNFTAYFTSFASNGFNLAGGSNAFNNGSTTYVGWQWNAGGSTVTNTSGTISAQVRANPTAGFSVVTYTGTGANATIGHGLGVAPSMMIVKSRSATFTWRVYHVSIGNGNVLYLSATDASTAESTAWNSTTPTSSVFSVGTGNGTNASAGTYVAYCFAPVAGYSAFGSYTGNGSADGPFVYLGFRPRFLLIKSSSDAYNWFINDSSRNPTNVTGLDLSPNLSNAESNDTPTFDFLSNGFKLRNTYISQNGSGTTYIYMAFAENPFKYANAR